MNPKQLLILGVVVSFLVFECLIPKDQHSQRRVFVSTLDLLPAALDFVLKSTKLTSQRENNPTGIG